MSAEPPADVAGLVNSLESCPRGDGHWLLMQQAADALASLSAVERANAELNSEVTRLYACRNELQEVTRAIDDPRVNNTITLDDAVRQLMQENTRLAAERDRYHDALIARHGGEPIALLAELDEARAERDALREALDALDRYSQGLPDYHQSPMEAQVRAALARAKEGA